MKTLSTYGVNGSSPLNELKYFDVTKTFPPDIMHDLLEGVIPLTIKLVVCQAHKEKHVTIQEINEELQQLSIGQNDAKNRPVQLSERLMQNSGIAGESLSILSLLVCEFLGKMKDTFGNVITPKCHYMIHYPRLITMHGPLHSLWCMRFEAKHQYLKNVASSCRNFIHVAKTLSDRHQMRQC